MTTDLTAVAPRASTARDSKPWRRCGPPTPPAGEVAHHGDRPAVSVHAYAPPLAISRYQEDQA